MYLMSVGSQSGGLSAARFSYISCQKFDEQQSKKRRNFN